MESAADACAGATAASETQTDDLDQGDIDHDVKTKKRKQRKHMPQFVFSAGGVLPTGLTSSNRTAKAAPPGQGVNYSVTNHPMCKKWAKKKKKSLKPNLPSKLTVISYGMHAHALTFQQKGGQPRVPVPMKPRGNIE
jgi:hypothetical protein